MQLSSDETRALAFIAALIALSILGRWVDRPRPLLADLPAVDLADLERRSEAALRGEKGTKSSSGPSAAGAPARASRPAPRELPDLNTATAAELEELPGIGPALAGRIVAYRDSAGRFRTLEELDSVRGVGPALLERLKPLLRLRQ